jgi:hypothetical protein
MVDVVKRYWHTDLIMDAATGNVIGEVGPNMVKQYWNPTTTINGAQTFSNLTLTGLLSESATDGITASTTQTQAAATLMTTELNRITVCATNGNGVALPVATPGLTIVVINRTTKWITVYGNNTAADTIDDVATGTGVQQMSNSTCIYSCTIANKWYTEGLGTGYAGSLQTLSFADGLSANAGGVQAAATPITTTIARFTTVGGAGYSAVLPAAAPGLVIDVVNASTTNSMAIFPAGSDAINSLAGAAAFTLPQGGVVTFVSTIAGFWHTQYVNPTASLPFSQYVTIAIASGVPTGANVAGAQFCTLLQSGATALTTPTAAAMLAAIPNASAGIQWKLRVINTNAGTLTITMDGTVTSTGTLTLVTNSWRDFDMTMTSTTAATMKSVGTGTYN